MRNRQSNQPKAVVVPPATGTVKFSITLDFEWSGNSFEGAHHSGYGGMYDPSKYKDSIATQPQTFLNYIKRQISICELDYKTIGCKVTECSPEILAAHNEAMRQIREMNEEKEKALKEKREKELLSKEAQLKAELAEIKKLKKSKK